MRSLIIVSYRVVGVVDRTNVDCLAGLCSLSWSLFDDDDEEYVGVDARIYSPRNGEPLFRPSYSLVVHPMFTSSIRL